MVSSWTQACGWLQKTVMAKLVSLWFHLENDATVQLQYTRDVLSGVVWLVVLAVTPQGSKAEGQEKVSLSS
ncbi:uncharacterized [Tachysurus ichikawai]